MSKSVAVVENRIKILALVLLPIILLGVIVSIPNLIPIGLPGRFVTEEVAVERVIFDNIVIPNSTQLDRIVILNIRNVGPIDASIQEVFVNDAIWSFTADPNTQLGRLATARITLHYDWDPGAPYTFSLLTSPSNLRFSKTVEFANLTPKPDLGSVMTLAQVGLFVGVVPVFLGLLWVPLLRRVGRQWMNFLLGFTVGLLVFLGVDSLAEASEVAGGLPRAFGGIGLVTVGTAGTFLVLAALNNRAMSMRKLKDKALLLSIAYMVALGIGLHNLGEGLAIGGAFALGAVALGAKLVFGFTVHNTTEGLAIASPIIREPVGPRHLATMGLIAGVPTIFGTWIGGFLQFDILSVLFLAVGAGAILEVVYEIARQMKGGLNSQHGYAGIIMGFAVLYLTALLVVR